MDRRAHAKTRNHDAHAPDEPLPKRTKCRLDPATKVQTWLLTCSPTHNDAPPPISCCRPPANMIDTIPAPPLPPAPHSVSDAPPLVNGRPAADDDSSVDTTQYIKSHRHRMHNQRVVRHRRRTNRLQRLRDRPADDSVPAATTRHPASHRNPPALIVAAVGDPAPPPPSIAPAGWSPAPSSTVDQVVPHMLPYGCAMAAAAADVPRVAAPDPRPVQCKRQKLRTLRQLNARRRRRPYATSSVSSSSLQEQRTGVRSAAFRALKALTRPKRKRRPANGRQADQS